ncbi:hypothetical protein GGF42_006497 [Coemansia sp. RSA 2424]|nr:hypothetical protein GGF42_006497 [Coemansia sp. RSA 2424]
MDDVALNVTAATAAAATTVGGELDDFGLIDYESPGPDPLPDIEEPEYVDESSAADGLIDFAESGDDDDEEEVHAATAPAASSSGGAELSEDSRMDFDAAADADQLEQSLHDSHLESVAAELDEDRMESMPAELDDSYLEPAVTELDDSYLEPVVAELDDDALLAEEIVGEHDLVDTDAAVTLTTDTDTMLATVPETWVFNDGEWMIYLGPNQHSYGADYQATLFAMPLDQLISALHSDISLREDTELALEFPSLALTIDQRDGESADTSLAQIYNCHAAAVRLGRLSEDLVNSPYFAHSTLTASSSFTPLPDSFAFIIHARPSVHSSFKRIMQIVAEDAQVNSQPAPPTSQLDESEEVAATGTVDAPQAEATAAIATATTTTTTTTDAPADKEPVNGTAAVVDMEEATEEPSASTADLLADAGDENEDEEDDEDYVAEGEEEGDFVLEEDDVDEEEEEEEEEEGDEYEDEDDDEVVDAVEHGEDDIDGIETRVESLSTSPTHKRAQDTVADLDDEVVPDCDEPAAKKPRSDDAIVHGDGKEAVAQL